MRTVLKLLLSVIAVVSAVYVSIAIFHSYELPFAFTVKDRHTLIIHAAPGVLLPAPITDDDRIDPSAQSPDTRSALVVQRYGSSLPPARTYTLHAMKGDRAYVTQVTTRPTPVTLNLRVGEAAFALIVSILAAITLILIWRGRGRAAWWLAAYCLCNAVGQVFNSIPIDGTLGIGLLFFGPALLLFARASFYFLSDTLVSPLLGRWECLLFRVVFGVMLLLGSIQMLGCILLLGFAGNAELALPRYSLFYSWIYLVPVVMLVLGYLRAGPDLKVKLGWATFAGVLLVIAVTFTNAQPLGFVANYLIGTIPFLGMVVSLAYALLRHRLVAVSIIIDQALVYGLMTTLVVGVVAAINSILLRVALPPGASLVLQVIVPLSLGIVLGRLRKYLDRLVERVFFRARYLSDKALRAFARRAGHFYDMSSLLDGTVSEICRRTNAPAVAIYSVEGRECKRLKQLGETEFPAELRTDDAALVALRADHKTEDLDTLASELGDDGCIFPMMVLSNLQGLIVLKNRPGEHFATDERKLLAHVARDVGAAWCILRARDNEALVSAMAAHRIEPVAAFAEAGRLAHVWSGG